MPTVTSVEAGGLPILSYVLEFNGGGADGSNSAFVAEGSNPIQNTASVTFAHSSLTTSV
jgi:hypothetical protein